jgi:predicted metal-dependent HD superfamily phosphohydrolase
MTTRHRWNHAWSQLGSSPLHQLFDEIVARYCEKHRHYHTLHHLDECLRHLDEVAQLAIHEPEIELALWFHDAIYDSRQQNNEELSAAWARSSAAAAAMPRESCDRIYDLIQVTGSHSFPKTTDEALLIDIDLSILGAPPDRFEEYEQGIRSEYSWVPQPIFEAKRRSVLKKFLQRETIFHTQYFIERYERQARLNLGRRESRQVFRMNSR